MTHREWLSRKLAELGIDAPAENLKSVQGYWRTNEAADVARWEGHGVTTRELSVPAYDCEHLTHFAPGWEVSMMSWSTMTDLRKAKGISLQVDRREAYGSIWVVPVVATEEKANGK